MQTLSCKKVFVEDLETYLTINNLIDKKNYEMLFGNL